MHVTQVVELLETSYYLKQYFIELSVVSVLLEVLPKVRVVPLDVENCSILS